MSENWHQVVLQGEVLTPLVLLMTMINSMNVLKPFIAISRNCCWRSNRMFIRKKITNMSNFYTHVVVGMNIA